MKHVWILTNKNDFNDVMTYTDEELLKEANSWFRNDCDSVEKAIDLFSEAFYVTGDFMGEEG